MARRARIKAPNRMIEARCGAMRVGASIRCLRIRARYFVGPAPALSLSKGSPSGPFANPQGRLRGAPDNRDGTPASGGPTKNAPADPLSSCFPVTPSPCHPVRARRALSTSPSCASSRSSRGRRLCRCTPARRGPCTRCCPCRRSRSRSSRRSGGRAPSATKRRIPRR
jgi:hypothetical protein